MHSLADYIRVKNIVDTMSDINRSHKEIARNSFAYVVKPDLFTTTGLMGGSELRKLEDVLNNYTGENSFEVTNMLEDHLETYKTALSEVEHETALRRGFVREHGFEEADIVITLMRGLIAEHDEFVLYDSDELNGLSSDKEYAYHHYKVYRRVYNYLVNAHPDEDFILPNPKDYSEKDLISEVNVVLFDLMPLRPTEFLTKMK